MSSSPRIEKQEEFKRLVEVEVAEGEEPKVFTYDGIKKLHFWELDQINSSHDVVIVQTEDSIELWLLETPKAWNELEQYFAIHHSEGGKKQAVILKWKSFSVIPGI